MPHPMDIHAGPESRMMDWISAKSRFISPGTVTSSAMDCTPILSTSSAILKAFSAVISSSQITCRRSLGMTRSVSTWDLSRWMPSSAARALRMPSNEKGRVTTPTVSAPVSLAISAITGAAPVPVPPPMPAATNIMSESRTASYSSSLLSSADLIPRSGLPPTPLPPVSWSPMRILSGTSHLTSA